MIILIADIIVILGCGYIGLFFAFSINNRITQLEAFEKMFTILAFDIEYMALPINEAISRLSNVSDGVVRKILVQTSEFLSIYSNIPFSDAWCRAVQLFKRELFLQKEEINALYDFSKNIGIGDCKQAVNSISMTIAKVKLAKDNALSERDKKSKLYKGAGFLFGILIVLLLL